MQTRQLTRLCGACGILLPIGAFRINNKQYQTRTGVCKTCETLRKARALQKRAEKLFKEAEKVKALYLPAGSTTGSVFE